MRVGYDLYALDVKKTWLLFICFEFSSLKNWVPTIPKKPEETEPQFQEEIRIVTFNLCLGNCVEE